MRLGADPQQVARIDRERPQGRVAEHLQGFFPGARTPVPAQPGGALSRWRNAYGEALAAAADRRRQARRRQRHQHDEHAGPRLLQRLEQRIAGVGIEHVRWIEDRHRARCAMPAQGQRVGQGADLIDPDLLRFLLRGDQPQVRMGQASHPLAVLARPAGGVRPRAQQRLRRDQRQLLTAAPRDVLDEQGMRESPLCPRLLQGGTLRRQPEQIRRC